MAATRSIESQFDPNDTQDECLSGCGQLFVFVSSMMLTSEELRLVNRLPLTWENQMETILIVLLVVFLLGGGGWGYSRWRRN